MGRAACNMPHATCNVALFEKLMNPEISLLYVAQDDIKDSKQLKTDWNYLDNEGLSK